MPNTASKTEQMNQRLQDLASRYPKALSTLGEYALGQIEWEERAGELYTRLSNKNRIIGGLLVGNALVAALAIFLAQRNHIQPYVAVIDKDMRILSLGQAIKGNNSLSEAVKREELRGWIRDTRTVVREFDTQTQFIYSSLRKTSGQATQKLREWYDSHRPNERGKNGAVAVQIDSVVPIPSSPSFEAHWTETVEENGSEHTEKWTGIFSVTVFPASSDEEAYQNPTGFHVSDLQWSKAQ